jgi:hypothetical protein
MDPTSMHTKNNPKSFCRHKVMSHESDDMSQNIVGPHKYPLLNQKSFCRHNSMPHGDAHV